MPRIARLVVPRAGHHVTQRGHDRRDVFTDDGDRIRYLSLVIEASRQSHCRVAAYCLMTNHVHLVLVPENQESLGSMMHRVNTLYGQYFNLRHGRLGAHWQGRFYSCPMDASHGVHALCYVELNPVRAGMLDVPEAYPWSSAAAHLGLKADDVLGDLNHWWRHWTPELWRKTLLAFQDRPELSNVIRTHTRSGRPAGGPSFAVGVEKRLDAHGRNEA